jgi:outer membrane protein assembly factor BamB
MRSLVFGSAMLALALGAHVIAADWPQVLGPGRNGLYDGPPLSESWGANGPRIVWRRKVGAGLSGPVVVGGRVILFHRVSNREIVEAIDAASGKTEWQYAYQTTYRDDVGFDEGPRAVPVVAGGVVYTFGAEGQLHAVDLASGTKIWSEDTMRRFGVPKGFFGAEFQTGKVRWSQERFGAGSVTLAGNRLLIVRENGEMVLAAASPEGFDPIARAQILPGTVRAFPAIADGMVYVRNDDTLVCLDLRK